MDGKGKIQAGGTSVRSKTDDIVDGGFSRSSDEISVMEIERRAGVKRKGRVEPSSQRRSRSLPCHFKVVPIYLSDVIKAYKKVKRNKGAAGVDGQSLSDFAENLGQNLYNLWNRLTSGNYQVSPVKEVEIPKSDGGVRKLGIPTVTDRIAQEVIKSYLEPRLDRIFSPYSYGYRSQKNAHKAICQVRKNCWRYQYAIDLDIKSFFDEVSHDLLMKALRKHVSEKWVLDLINKWLNAPIEEKDGKYRYRIGQGTPQGGVISPLLSNLFLHYVLDAWLVKVAPRLTMVRYADDAIIHCRTAKEAEWLMRRLRQRMEACSLRLHPDKTKIVQCKKEGSPPEADYPLHFDFLGYRFQPRTKQRKNGSKYLSYDCAISPKSEKRITEVLRESNFQRWSFVGIEVIAAKFNAKLRGWYNYYGEIEKFLVRRIFERFNYRLLKWAIKKYKRLKGSFRKAGRWLRNLASVRPDLFHHWKHKITSTSCSA